MRRDFNLKELLSRALPHGLFRVTLEASGLSSSRGDMESVDPIVGGFILFCINRRGNHWPALYDEMCRVAGRHLYKGMGYEELRERGLSFSLDGVEKTIGMVETLGATRVGGENRPQPASPHRYYP